MDASGKFARTAASSRVRALVVTITVPDRLSGIASAALITRFMMTCWIWAASASINGRVSVSLETQLHPLGNGGLNQGADLAYLV